MRIGILGYGSIGSRHAHNLMNMGHKVIYHDPQMADGLPKDEVIKRSDAVVISSPTSEHSRDIALCQSQQKPCFAEKPIASEIKAKGDSHLNWPLMVGYNMRFHPCLLKAREWLAEGRVGKPHWASFICAQYNDKPSYLRDGVILNWSHEIDMAIHLLGPPIVKAAAAPLNEGIADIILCQRADCQTTIHLDYVTKPEHRGFSISGPEGIIIANLPQRGIVYLDVFGNPKQQEQYPGTINDDYLMEMRAFLDRIEGKETPGCTAAEAIDVLKVCLQAKKMAK